MVSNRLVRVKIGSVSLRFVFICSKKLELCSASSGFSLTRNLANPICLFKVLLEKCISSSYIKSNFIALSLLQFKYSPLINGYHGSNFN